MRLAHPFMLTFSAAKVRYEISSNIKESIPFPELQTYFWIWALSHHLQLIRIEIAIICQAMNTFVKSILKRNQNKLGL